ncbi:hypothetical protein acsn021_30190 [Anaerocolumna cellulosilytica]|uniref:Uncharacterized protein n=1 Tax=Anaerocolumna cellulosilytica TaxID=433286 RepID=A0A6S6R7K8_9FIRM|nr:hypothetical protein [Anaerocolumna cellulosilytica]MBB5197431.1 hypothetical protein [Anaerocolumna cellulosilytica]BCJ95450.1 hypothetical protein acsn021_30190 [Anaerocolumna cellulosilytica]
MSNSKSNTETNAGSHKTSGSGKNVGTSTNAKVNSATSNHSKNTPTFTSIIPEEEERRDGPGGEPSGE